MGRSDCRRRRKDWSDGERRIKAKAAEKKPENSVIQSIALTLKNVCSSSSMCLMKEEDNAIEYS